MKKSVVIVCMMALLFAGNAFGAPVPFTISGISFDNLVGNSENLTWSVNPKAGPITFDLSVGGSHTFTYGTFSTTDFALDSGDRDDNNDSFRAKFTVQPPTPPSGQSSIASPDAYADWVWTWWPVFGYWTNEQVTVDFNNTPILVNFGSGGQYSVTFLDPGTLTCDGSLNLQAKVTLISESVPEPMSLLLLGLGLLGIGAARRKK